jgi:hypothetical protein
MQKLFVSIGVGSLLLVTSGLAPAQSANPPDKGGAVQTATPGSAAAGHDTHARKTPEELSLWRGRLDAFGTGAKATTGAAGRDADRDLHSAGADFQTAYLQLQNVGDDGWTAAKTNDERASDDLAAAWHGVHPEKI